MTPRERRAEVRFYCDADVLGMAKVLARLRPDVTFPGDAGGLIHRRRRDACPISSPAALDTEWIPIVATEGWVIITRDSRIQERPGELAAVKEHSAKMVALTGQEALNTWLQLEIVFSQWRSNRAARRRSWPVHLGRDAKRAPPCTARDTTALTFRRVRARVAAANNPANGATAWASAPIEGAPCHHPRPMNFDDSAGAHDVLLHGVTVTVNDAVVTRSVITRQGSACPSS